MANSSSQMAFYAPKIIKIPADVLVPVHNTSLAAPISDLPLDIIIRSLDDANVHEFSLETLEIMPSGRLHMLFLIKGQDGYQYLLTLSPPAGLRLLRHERWSIRSEAVILQWLSGISMKHQTDFKATISQGDNVCSRAGKDTRSSSKSHLSTASLLDYLPTLIKHGFLEAGSQSFYNISTPSLGATIWNLTIPLSPAERETIDFQTGQLLRRLSLYHSPNRKFGRAANILPQTLLKGSAGHHHQGGSTGESMANLGSDQWSEAFHILLESALRDAEDLLLTISYDRVRYQFYRFRNFLDGVTRPSFVAIDILDDTNTLVQRCDGLPANDACNGGRENGHPERKTSNPPSKGGRVKVTGLRDWSHCIFGDPLIASAFSRGPSPSFIRGFHSRLQHAEHGVYDYASIPTEDQAYAHVRLLLYECFHSVVAIAQEGYRWRQDSHTRELAGRKKLLDALVRLENLDDRGHLRHEPPHVEMKPAKRTQSQGRWISKTV